jgi:hypothetical protein
MQMLSRLETKIGIGSNDSHSLLAHGALESIFSCLVMVCKGNEGATHSKHHRRVNLAMGVVEMVD